MSTLFAGIGPDEAVLATDTRATIAYKGTAIGAIDGGAKIWPLGPRLLLAVSGRMFPALEFFQRLLWIRAGDNDRLTPERVADEAIKFNSTQKERHGQFTTFILGDRPEIGKGPVIYTVSQKPDPAHIGPLPPLLPPSNGGPVPYVVNTYYWMPGRLNLFCFPAPDKLDPTNLTGWEKQTFVRYYEQRQPHPMRLGAAAAIKLVAKTPLWREHCSGRAVLGVLPHHGPVFLDNETDRLVEVEATPRRQESCEK